MFSIGGSEGENFIFDFECVAKRCKMMIKVLYFIFGL
jgi:hypothetical protein